MGFQLTLGLVSRTINDLEQSLNISHRIEQKIFQNDLQLLIEKHQLSFDLDKEKYKNTQLKHILRSTEPNVNQNSHNSSNSKEIYTKLTELSKISKKREALLNKSREEVKRLSKENIKLNSALQHARLREQKMEHDIKALAQMIERQKIMSLAKCSNKNYSLCSTRMIIQLNELNTIIKRLTHRNNILTDQLGKANPPKCSHSTQVNDADFLT